MSINLNKKSRVSIILLLFSIILLFTNGCKKDSKIVAPNETGTMTDIDGNVYKTVKINNHWWMAENLKVKRYRNGDSIIYVAEHNYYLDSARWNKLDSGAYCIIDNSNVNAQNYQGKMFGFLYNAFTLMDARNIAPDGWHIPSDQEWKDLEISLGMDASDANLMSWRGTDQGNKLKIYTGWKKPGDIYSSWGTNESGFTALGGGCCMYNGVWGNPGTFSTGFWWTSSTYNGLPIYRYLDYNKANVFRFYGQPTYGFSIRCIMD